MGISEGIMKKLKLLTLAPIAILLVACGNELKQGKVVDKYTNDPAPIFMKSGNVMIPISQDREYIVVIEGRNTDGKTIEEKNEVSIREYRKIKVGQYWEAKK